MLLLLCALMPVSTPAPATRTCVRTRSPGVKLPHPEEWQKVDMLVLRAGRTLWKHGRVGVPDRRACAVRGPLGGVCSLGHWSGGRDAGLSPFTLETLAEVLGFRQCASVNQGGSRGETSGLGPWCSEWLGLSPGSAPEECDFGHLDPSLSFRLMGTTAIPAFPDGWESG